MESALAQTCEPVEVVVAVSGPAGDTEEAFGRIDDPRVRVVTLRAYAGFIVTAGRVAARKGT